MKKLLYLFIIFFVLLMSWDLGKQDVALAAEQQVIPDEAIRLRIIANSDSAEDQWVKRKVRDVVTEDINQWVDSLDNIDEARLIIEQHLPELSAKVKETVKENGYSYHEEVHVDLGIVEFPTKMYGNMVYPAGEYEALRITLGKAEGENWWCVLFPPLCFVDMSNGDAVVDQDSTQVSAQENDSLPKSDASNEKDVEVRFFIIDLLAKIMSFFKF